MFSLCLSSGGDKAETQIKTQSQRLQMPHKTYRMLWELWGKIISGQRDTQSLRGRCNLLVLPPGGVLDGKMATPSGKKEGVFVLILWDADTKIGVDIQKIYWNCLWRIKGETWEGRERLQTQIGMHVWPLLKERKGRRAQEVVSDFSIVLRRS